MPAKWREEYIKTRLDYILQDRSEHVDLERELRIAWNAGASYANERALTNALLFWDEPEEVLDPVEQVLLDDSDKHSHLLATKIRDYMDYTGEFSREPE